MIEADLRLPHHRILPPGWALWFQDHFALRLVGISDTINRISPYPVGERIDSRYDRIDRIDRIGL